MFLKVYEYRLAASKVETVEADKLVISHACFFSFDDDTGAKTYTALVGDRYLAIYSGTKLALFPL
jgi:hypothetical protein